MQVPNHNVGKCTFRSLAYISNNSFSNHNLNTFVCVDRENNYDTNEIPNDVVLENSMVFPMQHVQQSDYIAFTINFHYKNLLHMN